MSSAAITAELREYVRAVRAYHLTDIHGKKREYVDATTQELTAIADRIDEECERGLMVLPRDMDDVPIHIGDEMDCGEHFGIQEVEGFIHGAVAFTVCDPQPARICTCPAYVTRHYRKPTVESVLREYANKLLAWHNDSDPSDSANDELALVVEYAEKLREVMS